MFRFTPLRTRTLTRSTYRVRGARPPRARRRPTAARRRPAGRAGALRRAPSCPGASPPTRARGRRDAGCGRSTSSTTRVSRPERRSAARRPSATARPCVSAFVVGRGLERVRERVAEVEDRPLALLVRIAQADGRLEGGAAAHELVVRKLPERLAREQPRLHDLGHALEALRLGQRLEQRGIDRRVRAGQWKAPTRFLPCGRSIAVLPPIAASTWATRLVGTGVQAMPRRYVAAAKPAASVVQPPPSATIVPLRSRRRSCQRRSSAASVFASSPGGSSCVSARRGAERELRVHAVDAGDVRVRDERDRAVAGHELAEPLQRAALDVDAGGGEHDVVGVASRSRRRPRRRAARAARSGGGTRSRPAPAGGRCDARGPMPSRRRPADGRRRRHRRARRQGVSTASRRPAAITVAPAAERVARRTAPRARGTPPRPASRRAPRSDRAPRRSPRRRRRTAGRAPRDLTGRRSSCRRP